MSKKYWNSEKLLSLTALLVSLLTLAVFIYQTSLIRKQQYMSVYPHLRLGNGGTGTLNYQFTLANEGIGPAFITDLKIYAGQGKVYDDVVDYVDSHINEEDSVWYMHSNLSPGVLIPPQDSYVLIMLADREMTDELGVAPNTLEGAARLYHVLNNDSLEIEITYASIYGEEWTITNGTTIPEKQ